ncbi:MAG TPA: BTAD domain-containing putative transcriptional regulator [Gemmatimonadaceae bacterium]|nr:BTAD domain-containing putative transcriptional regulator [Gemmatimonadaceae bacterium]
MFSLKLLGGASIQTPAGPLAGRAAQRRRVALLAMLAAARGRGVSRDKLIAYLWPEQDAEHGRALLSDSIYRVNQALGAEAIISAGDDLRLSIDVLPSDVGDFEDAIERGEWQRAAELYGGPFLDGFFLADAEEFERWAAGERDRLGRAYARVLESLSESAERRGNAVEAVRWWRALAAQDPYSSRVVVRLMRALDRSGDRAAALQHARIHATLLAEEFGTEPDAAVAELAASMRAQPIAPAPSPPASASVATESAPPTQTPSPPAVVARQPSTRRHWWPVAAAIIAIVIAVAMTARGRASEGSKASSASVAVLPFVDLSAAHDHEYFSDGMTEELINTLGRVQGVRVASRTSSFAFKGKTLDVREVGRQLGVATVLDGSVRAADSTLRITARLSNALDGYQLWSRTYERKLEDVFDIQEEISRSIVETLKGTLVGRADSAATARRDTDLEAYNLYLRGRHALYMKGRYSWYRRTEEGLKAAAAYFAQAIEKDSTYALAHAGLADAHAVLGFYDYLAPREAFPRAERAARRAMAIDSALVQPYATLGYVELYYNWNWPRAEEWFTRAIEVGPRYSTAYQWYANFLTVRARFEEAVRAMGRAQEIDPLSLIASAAHGWVLYYAGEHERAAEQCRLTLELDPDYAVALLWRGWALQELGREAESVTLLERAATLTNRSTLFVASLARARAVARDSAGARALLRELETVAARGYVPKYEVAKVHLALGERERALDLLERAYEERSHSMAFLGVDPQLRPLHGDARYEALVRRVGAARMTSSRNEPEKR